MLATHDLFLSYRTARATEVKPLVDALSALGLRVWQDVHRVDEGDSISEAVLAGLASSRDLFAIERELWRQAPEVVLAGRGARSKHLVEGFFTWAAAAALVNRPDSALGKALGYALRQQRRLCVFLDRGDVPMHNNLSELMLRQLVVGRKNWLFARSEGGAEAAATLYTLIGSCLLQGIDPELYLDDVLGRLLDHPAGEIGALTPRRWRLARGQARAGAEAS